MIITYKPVDTARIEAMLFTEEAAYDAKDWVDSSRPAELADFGGSDKAWWRVETLEGWVDMPYGSYLIRGTSGEFYPCDPDIFEKRWVEA